MALTKKDLQLIAELLDLKLEEKLEEKLNEKLDEKLSPLHAKIDDLKEQMDEEFQLIWAEMSEMRREMKAFRGELKDEIMILRVEFHHFSRVKHQPLEERVSRLERICP